MDRYRACLATFTGLVFLQTIAKFQHVYQQRLLVVSSTWELGVIYDWTELLDGST
jgi:hypothetical protein